VENKSANTITSKDPLKFENTGNQDCILCKAEVPLVDTSMKKKIARVISGPNVGQFVRLHPKLVQKIYELANKNVKE